MKNLMILIKSFFLLRPRFLSTIFFIPILYGIGWALSQPLLLFNFEEENLSLIGTIITFLLFIFLLPYWFYIKRNKSSAWVLLGITKDKFLKNIFNFSKGILFALVLIILILVPLLQKNYISWIGEFSPSILLNSILLGFGVGFAEEIIFRGWLLEELKFEYGTKISIALQAIVFSFVHNLSNEILGDIIGLRLGFILFGIFLSLVKIRDKGSLWNCIGIHGGLVGIWFLMNHGLIEFKENTPSFLAGPFSQNIPNPIGSFIAILILLFLCIFYAIKTKNIFSRTCN
ncbi:CPBP family intramembrane metalloprotease [Prochlorococcus marinus XMU1411]|uniref:CPBP family intramembrane glutamic endopeptidase n=1 Tax=Prochlorococcus marinus TaxID=1219 RepID=UPI001ADD36CD|nr:CPBP family intramembrane glutamic endopeptidase [Prochlorococcus marinus]MBO8243231.1 CPBP family intramembrane metalloprotease [Prochlorococcus marinus XMU1411]MBW3054350.1 CPBP family intramembrane metalloprotease [Prochlorococcus marinus str. MU1411]MCR8537923.1 CPBP family intramembrane metalloprotease [Prochlorococcus marinus CUG1430]